MANSSPFLTHRQTVDALSFRYVRKGWRAGVRWLLYKLADWADVEETKHGVKDQHDRHTLPYFHFANWQKNRWYFFERLQAWVWATMERGAEADKSKNYRTKRALRRVNNILIRKVFSESPFAGKYAPAPGEDPATTPGKEYCGTHAVEIPRAISKEKGDVLPKSLCYYRHVIVSHSHKFRGCYVWFETWKDSGESIGWRAWHEGCVWVSWGRSPTHAVKNLLRDWRKYILRDRKERFGTFTDKELDRMDGWKLRQICRKRGLPTSRRLDDMRNQLRGGQKSLMSLLK